MLLFVQKSYADRLIFNFRFPIGDKTHDLHFSNIYDQELIPRWKDFRTNRKRQYLVYL